MIGIGTNRQTFDMLEQAKRQAQSVFDFSHAETKQEIENLVENEMADSEDNRNVEDGVRTFIDWIKKADWKSGLTLRRRYTRNSIS